MRALSDREVRVTAGEKQAARWQARETSTLAKEEELAKREDAIQRTSAQAEQARREADALWKTNKVRQPRPQNPQNITWTSEISDGPDYRNLSCPCLCYLCHLRHLARSEKAYMP